MDQMTDPRKILLALQFWDGDKRPAMQVARLIADLERTHSAKADFLFVARFDCTHNLDTINYVAKKFNTHHYINRNRRATGWPWGCNELFFGTMDWVYSQAEAKRIPDYKAVMLLEGDSGPLHPNWVSQLSEEWDKAKVKVYGPLLDHGPHINGNCMLSGDMTFLHWLTRTKGGCSPHGGWDFLLYQDFKNWVVPTRNRCVLGGDALR
jgi:hypothetical protein